MEADKSCQSNCFNSVTPLPRHLSTFVPHPQRGGHRRAFSNDLYSSPSVAAVTSLPQSACSYADLTSDLNHCHSPVHHSNQLDEPHSNNNPFYFDHKVVPMVSSIRDVSPQFSYESQNQIYAPQRLAVDPEWLGANQYSNEQALRTFGCNGSNSSNASMLTSPSGISRKSAIYNNPYCSPMVARRLLAHQTQMSAASLTRTRYGSLDDIKESTELEDHSIGNEAFNLQEINIGKSDTLSKKVRSKWRIVRKAISRGASLRKAPKF